MIELRIKCKDQLEAYEITTFLNLKHKITEIEVVEGKVKKKLEADEETGIIKAFGNEKKTRRINNKIKVKKEKTVINKHI